MITGPCCRFERWGTGAEAHMDSLCLVEPSHCHHLAPQVHEPQHGPLIIKQALTRSSSDDVQTFHISNVPHDVDVYHRDFPVAAAGVFQSFCYPACAPAASDVIHTKHESSFGPCVQISLYHALFSSPPQACSVPPLGLPVKPDSLQPPHTERLPSAIKQGSGRRSRMKVSWNHAIQFWFPEPDQLEHAQIVSGGEGATWPRRPRRPQVQMPVKDSTSSPNVAQSQLALPKRHAIVPGSLPDVKLEEGIPSERSLHSCFDSRRGLRFRQRDGDWTAWRCVTDCIASSYVPAPCGRVLQFPVQGLPEPQSVIYSSALFRTHWPVVVDMRALGVPLQVLDVPRRSTVLEALVPLYHPNFPPGFRHLLNSGHWHILLNGVPSNQGSLVDDPVDVVAIMPPTEGISNSPARHVPEEDIHWPVQAPVPPRPPTPPVPRERWSRRIAATGPDVSLEPDVVVGMIEFTVFDPVMHVRVMSASEALSPQQLIAEAIARSPYLGDQVQGRFLRSSHLSYPSPQLVLHGPIPEQQRVVPVLLQADSEQICTLSIDRDWSAFELAIALREPCACLDSIRFQVARRVVSVESDHMRIPPFEARRMRDADVIAFRGIIKNWTPQSPARYLTEESERPAVGCRVRPAQVLRSISRPPQCVYVHRVGHALQEVPIDHLWRPARLRAEVLRFLSMPPGSLLKILPFSPHFQGLHAHVIILGPDDLQRHRKWAVVDTRRMSVEGPPFRVMSVPSRLSLGFLRGMLDDEVPDLGPMGTVFTDRDLFAEGWQSMPDVSLLTLIPHARTEHHPAMCFTLNVLEQGAGYQSAFCHLPPARLTGRVADPLPPARTTSSTTTGAWVHDCTSASEGISRPLVVDPPAREGHARPDPRENVLVLVASAQCVPGMVSVHRHTDLPEITARVLHYVTRHAFVPSMPTVQYVPRVFYTPARMHMLFATVHDEHENHALIWIDAMPLLPQPLFIQADGLLTLGDIAFLLRCDAAAQLSASINGMPWSGAAHLFSFGDVVQLRASSVDLVSLAPDSARNVLVHAAALAFPVYGPYMRFRGYTIQTTPSQAYVHFGRQELYTHFRAVYLALVRDLILLPGSQVMFVGPGLPCIRVCTGVEGEPSNEQAQALYDSFFAGRSGARRVVSLRWSMNSVWLCAALPPGFANTMWAFCSNNGVSSVEAARNGDGLQAYPLMEGTVLAPTTTFGGVGLALHTFAQRPQPTLRFEEPQVGDEGVSFLQVRASRVLVRVWSEDHPDFTIGIDAHASFEEVARVASLDQQRPVCPFRFVPIYPACATHFECIECSATADPGTFPVLVKFSNGRWPMVVRVCHLPTVWDLQQAIAMPSAVFHVGEHRWSGPQDGLIPGSCVMATLSEAVHWNRVTFQLCLTAALNSDFQSQCDHTAALQRVICDACNLHWPMTRLEIPALLGGRLRHDAAQALEVPFVHHMVQCFIFTDGSATSRPEEVRAGASFNVWFGDTRPLFCAGAFAVKVDLLLYSGCCCCCCHSPCNDTLCQQKSVEQ